MSITYFIPNHRSKTRVDGDGIFRSENVEQYGKDIKNVR